MPKKSFIAGESPSFYACFSTNMLHLFLNNTNFAFFILRGSCFCENSQFFCKITIIAFVSVEPSSRGLHKQSYTILLQPLKNCIFPIICMRFPAKFTLISHSMDGPSKRLPSLIGPILTLSSLKQVSPLSLQQQFCIDDIGGCMVVIRSLLHNILKGVFIFVSSLQIGKS